MGFDQKNRLEPTDVEEDIRAYGRVLSAALDACPENMLIYGFRELAGDLVDDFRRHLSFFYELAQGVAIDIIGDNAPDAADTAAKE